MVLTTRIMKVLLLNKLLLAFTGLVLLTCIFSCQQPNKAIQQQLKEALLSEPSALGESQNAKQVMIVIPRTGCSGCIGMADFYYKEASYDTSKIQFIFTKVSSVKTLKIRLGEGIIKKDFVHIDTEGIFSSQKLSSIYPMVVFLENSEIKDIEFLSPDKKNLINELRAKISVDETFR